MSIADRLKAKGQYFPLMHALAVNQRRCFLPGWRPAPSLAKMADTITVVD
jgi:hypothetical protein